MEESSNLTALLASDWLYCNRRDPLCMYVDAHLIAISERIYAGHRLCVRVGVRAPVRTCICVLRSQDVPICFSPREMVRPYGLISSRISSVGTFFWTVFILEEMEVLGLVIEGVAG